MSAARAKGTAWETAVVTYLRGRGWPYAERRTMGGSNDRGDIAGIVGVIVECKSAKRVELGAWLDEAIREANVPDHPPCLPAVWFHRRGKGSPADGFVLLDGHTFTKLLTEAGY